MVGSQLNNLILFNVDVNECAFDNGGCMDRCTNFGGSYQCSCDSGFLQADGLSCGDTSPCKFMENYITHR